MAHDHMIEMLDLDAEVLHDYYREVITWVGREAAERPRIVDLGAGSGTGSLALARELPASHDHRGRHVTGDAGPPAEPGRRGRAGRPDPHASRPTSTSPGPISARST